MKKPDILNVTIKTILLYLPVMIISVIALHSFLYIYKAVDQSNISDSQKLILLQQKKSVGNSFNEIFSDILFLKQNMLSRNYIKNDFTESPELGDLVLNFIRNKKIYRRVSIYDNSGKLRFSADKSSSVFFDQPPEELDVDLFYQVSALPKRTVYISQLNLIKHSDKPNEAIIDFSMTIRDSEGKIAGIIVLSHLADQLLDSISESAYISFGDLYLLDSKSNIIISPDIGKTILSNKYTPDKFGNLYPNAWEQIYLKEHGTYAFSENLVFYNTLRPVPTFASKTSNTIDLYLSDELKYLPASYEWKLVSFITPEFWAKRYSKVSNFAFFIFLVVNIAFLITALVIVKVRLKAAQNEALHQAKQDEYLARLEESSIQLKNQVTETQELVHILCHDLVNPIGCISGALEIVECPDETQIEIFDLMTLSAIQCTNIIDIVRTMRALDEGKKVLSLEMVNVAESLQTSIKLIGKKAKTKGVDIIVKAEPDIFVLAEPVSLINSVISNILSNAIKFSFENSSIEVTSRISEDRVLLEIRDHGAGMPRSILENIFDSGKPTSRPGTDGEKGTGFGMPLVKKFLTVYGGDISVESKDIVEYPEDHGTTVTMIFKKGS